MKEYITLTYKIVTKFPLLYNCIPKTFTAKVPNNNRAFDVFTEKANKKYGADVQVNHTAKTIFF